jgi:hypothetical protein
MDGDKLKTCRYCTQQIKVPAKVCPYCRQWVSLFSFRNLSVLAAITYLWMFVLMLTLVVLVARLTNSGIDFAPYRSQISVVDSHMYFETNRNLVGVYVITVITNQTDKEWKEIHFDARFFDKTGTLIDVGRGGYYDFLYPKTDGAFRIDANMLCPATNYASYKIYIGSARDAHARF